MKFATKADQQINSHYFLDLANFPEIKCDYLTPGGRYSFGYVFLT